MALSLHLIFLLLVVVASFLESVSGRGVLLIVADDAGFEVIDDRPAFKLPMCRLACTYESTVKQMKVH